MSSNNFTDDELIEFRDELRKHKEIGSKKALAIIHQLSSAKVTTTQLSHSKIAQTIQSLSNISILDDDENETKIKQLCTQLISKWKKIVADEKLQKEKAQKNQTSISKNQATTAPPTQMKRMNSGQSTSTSETFLENESPIYQDKGTLPTFKSDTRTKGLIAIQNMFLKVKHELNVEDHEWVNLIVQLEKHIFNRSQQVITYKSNVRELLSMFSSNDIIVEVISKLLNKEIHFQDVAETKSSVFLTEEKKLAIKKAQEELLAVNDPQFYNNMRRQRMQGVEGEICKACKKKTAFLVKELQTRSADEPMTRFMECNSCGKSWRD